MILSPHRRPQIKNCWTLNVKTFCNMTYQISKYFETVQNDPVNQQWHGQKGKCVIHWLMFRMKLLILEEWSDLLSPGSVIQRQVLICGGNALNIGGRGGSSVSFSSLLVPAEASLQIYTSACLRRKYQYVSSALNLNWQQQMNHTHEAVKRGTEETHEELMGAARTNGLKAAAGLGAHSVLRCTCNSSGGPVSRSRSKTLCLPNKLG